MISKYSRSAKDACFRRPAIHRVVVVFFSLWMILFLVGCRAAPSTPDPSVPPGTATQQAQETLALQPTDTPFLPPTPSPLPPRALLLATPGADAALVQDLQALLAELAQQSGLLFEVTADPAALSAPDTRLVVLVSPDPGAQQLAAANPQVQFLAVDIPGVQPGQNLSVIGAQHDADQQGFLAGYLAALITPDWRVGAISISDTPQGVEARQGFMNGVVFYCGLCRSSYPPFNVYPQYYELAAANAASEGQLAADYLLAKAVATVYIFPGAVDESTLLYLAQAGVSLIGAGPPPAGVQDHWALSIRPDWGAALHQAWTSLLAGESGLSLQAPLHLADHNENLLSIGRMRLVEQTLADLAFGYIETGAKGQTNSSP